MSFWRLIVLLALLLSFGYWQARACELVEWRGDDLALVCVGMDPVRVWPWPPVSPYFEDPFFQFDSTFRL